MSTIIIMIIIIIIIIIITIIIIIIILTSIRSFVYESVQIKKVKLPFHTVKRNFLMN